MFAVSTRLASAQESGRGGHRRNEEDEPKDITSWLHIGEDGIVTAFTGKVEIGQNIRTSLAQSVADELHVPFENVRMVMADTALTPYDMGTFGSRTTPTMAPQLRRVANAARELLIQEAAKEWRVATDTLVARDAKVSRLPPRATPLLTQNLPPENFSRKIYPTPTRSAPAPDWTIAGKAIAKVDARDFVTGRHQYTTDFRHRIALRQSPSSSVLRRETRDARHQCPSINARRKNRARRRFRRRYGAQRTRRRASHRRPQPAVERNRTALQPRTLLVSQNNSNPAKTLAAEK